MGGNPGVLYPVSKGAIIQLTRAMAAHHGPDNIRFALIPAPLCRYPEAAG